jgi:hypothetical protein
MDLGTMKLLILAAFNAGTIWAGIRMGLHRQAERQKRMGQQITRLTQYKAWSHRAFSVLIAFHRQNHPGQFLIEDWNEIDEGVNGGTNGDA